MARDLLFVQGAGEGTHDQWDNKLVASLSHDLGSDYRILYPRMPNEADPSLVEWKAALTDHLRTLQDGAILVGHSFGGTLLMHVMAEEGSEFVPGAIVSIAAPFFGEGGWPSDELTVQADLGSRLPAAVAVLLYHGTADTIVPVDHVDLYANAIPHAVTRKLSERDHQLNDNLSDIARDIRALAAPASHRR